MLVRTSRAYSPNTKSARPAVTASTCRPSSVNETGADTVVPPSEARQTSRPVSESKAKQAPSEHPDSKPPPVASTPPYSSPDCDETYFHFRWPVAASSARISRVDGSVCAQPLPTKSPFCPRVILLGGNLVKTELLSVAGTNINSRFGSNAGFCQLVPPSMPGLIRAPAADTLARFDRIGRPA